MEDILDYNYCAELQYQLTHNNIDQNLKKILDFFVSNVTASFNKDPSARTLLEVLALNSGEKRREKKSEPK